MLAQSMVTIPHCLLAVAVVWWGITAACGSRSARMIQLTGLNSQTRDIRKIHQGLEHTSTATSLVKEPSNSVSEPATHLSRNNVSHTDLGGPDGKQLEDMAGLEVPESSLMSNDGHRYGDDAVGQGNTDSLLRQYSGTVRKGGLEGFVVPSSEEGVIYRTPQLLEAKLTDLVQTVIRVMATYTGPVGGIKDVLQDVRSLSMYPQVAVNLARWKDQSLWIKFVAASLRAACPNATAEFAGTSSREELPTCLILYLTALSPDEKRSRGLQLRNALLDRDLVNQLLDTHNGFCPVVARVLHFNNSFCQEMYDAFMAVPYFVAASGEVQLYEQKQYGSLSAMLQLSSRHSLASAVSSTSNSLEQIRTEMLFERLWKFFGLYTTKVEALKLLKLWFNDPVHKWRYGIGLFQWLSFVGVLLVDQHPPIFAG